MSSADWKCSSFRADHLESDLAQCRIPERHFGPNPYTDEPNRKPVQRCERRGLCRWGDVANANYGRRGAI